MRQLRLTENHAFNLARTVMVPGVLFAVEDENGVVFAAEYDGDEDAVVHEFDPFEFGPAH